MADSGSSKTMLIGGGIVVVAGALVYLFAFGDSADSTPPPARPLTAMDESSDEFDDSGSGTLKRGTGSDAARDSGSRLAGTTAKTEDDADDAEQTAKKKKRRNSKKRSRKSAQGEEEEEKEDQKKDQGGEPSFRGVPRGGG